ncbi:MAG: hypothetical protein EBT13_12555 [Rhodobacteraceae bacterium]|nr:hypothetical protein [Paracoccaceae bacterium]
MIQTVDAGSSARLHCHDAIGREFDLLHFAGSDLLTISFSSMKQKRIHLNPRQSTDLACVLDHFARHRVMQSAEYALDYEI